MVMKSSLQATKRWLETAVVGGGLYHRPLCPFASKPWKQDKVKLVVSEVDCEEKLLQIMRQELDVLFPTSFSPEKESITTTLSPPETSLIITPFLFQNDYRKMIHFSWKIMEHISTQNHLIEKVQVSTVVDIHYCVEANVYNI
jgi:hypothetical protein